MQASNWERDIALDIVDFIINKGFAESFYAEKKPYSMWDWFDKHELFNEGGFQYNDGATKGVIFHEKLDGWVIKFRLPPEDPKKDYCAREYENYVAAKDAGLEYYFAATEYLCEREGICFYLQEQVICDEEVDSDIYDKLQCQYEESGTPYDNDSLWNEVEELSSYDRVMLLYGDAALADFISEHHINDMHCGNFGLAGDHYVMVDFSGFGSQVWAG